MPTTPEQEGLGTFKLTSKVALFEGKQNRSDLHPQTLTAINNLAYVPPAQGKYSEAISLSREAARSRPDDVTHQTRLRTLLKNIAEARKKTVEDKKKKKKKDAEAEQRAASLIRSPPSISIRLCLRRDPGVSITRSNAH